jgi:hypothetical protein
LLSQQQIKSAAIAASLMVGISGADAAAAAVTVDGWRYIQGPNDLHVYLCDRSDCVKGSRVICYFSPPNSAVTPGLFRKQESWVSEMLGEPGKTFSPSALDLATGRTRSIAAVSDGSKAYYVSGSVAGPKWQAWLSSSSSDAKASETNLGTFESAFNGVKN